MSDCQFFSLRLTTTFCTQKVGRLFRDQITENDKCYLCSGSQTLVHLFVDCDFSKVFWIDITSCRSCKNSPQIKFKQRDILYAFHPGKQSFLGINFCLLEARNYIYISAKNEDPFCSNSYLAFFLKNKLGTDKKETRDLVTLLSTFCCCCCCLWWPTVLIRKNSQNAITN